MLQRYRRMLRRRVRLSLMDWLLIVLFLIIWMVASRPVPTERAIPYNKTSGHVLVQPVSWPDKDASAIPYNKTSGHVLVQLARLPENSETETYTEPKWTLYGDGTLIFRTDPGDNLRRAQLSPGEIQHILDVIINQEKFFTNTEHSYVSITSERDDDELLLTVDANGQRKEIVLVHEPMKRMAIVSQTTHVFTIEQFLLEYHPVHTVLYSPSPDPDGVSGDGK